MSDNRTPRSVNYGGAQINQTGGSGNTANIFQSQMPPEYTQLMETLKIQVATMLEIDEFAASHDELAHVKAALDTEAADQPPSGRLTEAVQLLKDVVSGAATSALAQVVLKNASRLLALIP